MEHLAVLVATALRAVHQGAAHHQAKLRDGLGLCRERHQGVHDRRVVGQRAPDDGVAFRLAHRHAASRKAT